MNTKFCIGFLLFSCSAIAALPEIKSQQALSVDSDSICRYESTSRGVLDDKKLSSCLANHVKWIGEVVRLDSENREDFYTKASYPFCYERSTRRGTTNAGLMYICLESEVDAHKDVMYYLDKLGKEKIVPIVRSEIAKYGSWGMVRFKIKNDLDPPP
ncbi:hypothetical protein IQK56_07460 [Pseudomonas sp. MAFF 301449]|uniref:Uncharacterized protein n=1 Tax=Pseudomonas cyclaminis TaxID=2781239 RepID=A0ABR9SPH6_9PSED|nr:hypothetical protein [Pseudomonas cyclaminis]MBE8590783.1 hypothetical protein [Pseudomonas cyclaminis]MBE8598724.1 hypothetical protein [Pseudomonas cyclaminis]